MNTPDSQTEKIRCLLKSFSTAMLITHGNRGQLHARPMAVAQVENDCGLWFITGDHTSTAWEVSSRKQAHVVFQKDHSAYLSLSGTAMLVKNREKLQQLWKETFRVWFPGGKDDPSIVLISFRPKRAEYWDETGFNKISCLWEATRAYVSGKKTRVKEGEQHGVVSLA